MPAEESGAVRAEHEHHREETPPDQPQDEERQKVEAAAASRVEIGSLVPQPSHTAAAIAVLYVFGYVTATAHFAGFGLPRTELLQVRYIAAGLLFVLLTSIPASLGFACGTGVRRRCKRIAWRDWADAAVLGLMSVTSWWLALSIIGLGSADPLAYAPNVVVFSSVAFISWRPPASERDRFTLRTVAPQLWLSLLMLSAIFGLSAYGSVFPAFGGGAGWKGWVAYEQGDSTISESVLVIDRSEGHLVVAHCGGDVGVDQVVVTEIPLGRVVLTTLSQFVDPRLAMTEMRTACVGREPAVGPPLQTPAPQS